MENIKKLENFFRFSTDSKLDADDNSDMVKDNELEAESRDLDRQADIFNNEY